jgi:hypothetical protein
MHPPRVAAVPGTRLGYVVGNKPHPVQRSKWLNKNHVLHTIKCGGDGGIQNGGVSDYFQILIIAQDRKIPHPVTRKILLFLWPAFAPAAWNASTEFKRLRAGWLDRLAGESLSAGCKDGSIPL